MSNQRYKKINDYAIIGNRHSSALIGIDGSIDWCCLPSFDSPSVFAAILDADKGGRWQICPTRNYNPIQTYEENTNVLYTIFETNDGKAKLTDFMPCFMYKGEFRAFNEIHRRIEYIDGNNSIDFLIHFEPRLNYSKGKTTIKVLSNGCIAYGDENNNHVISLIFQKELNQNSNSITVSGKPYADFFSISKDNPSISFILKSNEHNIKTFEDYKAQYKLEKTIKYWKNWVANIKYKGRWSKEVIRSALTLKLLHYAPTGAILAAATTSLPEKIGGSMNWDYRFSWIRDAAFSLWSLSLLGFYQETRGYIDWLMSICSKHKPSIMLSISGNNENLSEKEIDHLEGYKKSKPVRVGNAASGQLQLDVYGIIIDALYFSYKEVGWASKEAYEFLVREYAETIVESWKNPDNGIWELRGERKYYTESRVWCYVGLDRAVKLANYLGYYEDAERWKPIRKKIKEEVLSKGWSEKKNAFTMFYGNDEILDAALLLMPLVKFLPATHPKMASTIERIKQELSHNGLICRFRLPNSDYYSEGTFTICTFWMVDCLILLGRIDEALKLFNKLIGLANHIGLYSEEIDSQTGNFLGNFPQAFTHMGLISTAVNLDRALAKTNNE